MAGDVRIVLVRHGKPGDVSVALIVGHDIGRWVRLDRAPLT